MRLIDADALLMDIARKAREGFPANRSLTIYAESCVAHAPTVDALPVLRARWEYNEEDEPHCTNCGECADLDSYEFDTRGKARWATSSYCPNCGAKMDAK